MQASALEVAKLRGAKGRSAATPQERQSLLLAEIEADISKVCPEYAEFSRTLRHFVSRHLSEEKNHRAVIGVVSADHGEGRTTVALSIADALADIYSSVVLVEMGVGPGERSLAADLNLEIASGIETYLQDEATLEDVLVPTTRGNLWLIPSGQDGAEKLGLETTARTRELFRILRRQFGVTVVDLPPLLEDEETPALLGNLDGVVLVVNAGRTSAESVAKTVQLCAAAPLRGVLLNRSRRSTPRWVSSLTRS